MKYRPSTLHPRLSRCLRAVWWVGIWAAALGMLLPFTSRAEVDNWEVEGVHGQLHVSGELMEAACRLDMTSQMQQIDLGDIFTRELLHPGDRGQAVAFTLKLRDCVRSGGDILDTHSGGRAWDAIQPVASVVFVAPADVDVPQLALVRGITGFGLRITDSLRRDVRLGERALPVFVSPSNDELVYYVQPERTAAPLTPGPWQATVGFQLRYD